MPRVHINDSRGTNTGAALSLCMTTTIADQDLESEVFSLRRPPLAERIALVNQLNMLEGQLLDGADDVRGGARSDRAHELLTVVNSLRHRLGWLPIDEHHRRGWPSSASS
jgi:hypothetical protein